MGLFQGIRQHGGGGPGDALKKPGLRLFQPHQIIAPIRTGPQDQVGPTSCQGLPRRGDKVPREIGAVAIADQDRLPASGEPPVTGPDQARTQIGPFLGEKQGLRRRQFPEKISRLLRAVGQGQVNLRQPPHFLQNICHKTLI